MDFFTTVEQGKQWFPNKKNHNKIMPVMEGSTFFNYETRDSDKNFFYRDRKKAIEKTGMTGSPSLLWVGRLDDNKDPLTVLAGFQLLAEKYENAMLYMIYSEADLINEVKKKLITLKF